MISTSRTTVLLTFMASAAVLLTLVTIACNAPGSGGLVKGLRPPEATARPEWEPPLPEPLEPPEEPSVVEMHLDVSFPMAGFLPLPSRPDDLSTFQEVTLNVANHMAGIYGSAGGVAVQWRGIGHDLVDLPRSPRIQPSLFDGRSTRLDLSIDRMLAAFRSGQAEAAALVTDLMATAEVTGVIGPVTVANALGDWLRSEGVRSGVFHVGLLGVKAEYRGVTHPTECPPGPPLGCWYDERLPGFRRLDSVARTPFYVLVVGRGADAVTSVLESLQRGIVELDRDVEAQWELLTRRSLSFDTAASCKAPPPQYALFVDERGQHRCVRDDRVTLFCDFEKGFRPDAGRGVWDRTPTDGSGDGETPAAQGFWNRLRGIFGAGESRSTPAPGSPPEQLDVRVNGTRLEFDLDCESLRSARPPNADLALRLDVTGTVDDPTADWSVRLWAQRSSGGATDDNEADWSEWSTERAEFGKTTQLDAFVRAVRVEPDRYRVELPAILRFPG